MLAPLIAGALTAAVPFYQTYSPEYNGSATALPINGFEPPGEGGFPVILVLPPTYYYNSASTMLINVTDYLPEFEGGAAQHSADCSHILATAEYPDLSGYEETCDYFKQKAETIFIGPGSLVEAVCSRPKADCSKGLSVFGVSQGAHLGLIGASLPGLTYPVTAVASFANGWEDIYSAEMEDCWSDATVSPNLPRTKRRYVGTAAETAFGNGSAASVIYQHKVMSGYDCGESLDCIQADGSGYVIQPERLNLSHGQTIIYSLLGDESWSVASGVEFLYSGSSVDLPLQCQYGVTTPGQKLFDATVGKWVTEPLRKIFYDNLWPMLSARILDILGSL